MSMPDGTRSFSPAVFPAALPVRPAAPDKRRLARLRHCDALELAADDSAPGIGRRRIAARLTEWSLPEFTDAAWAVSSELLANSVAATQVVQWTGPLPPVRLWLRGGRAGGRAEDLAGGRSGWPGGRPAAPATVAILAWDACVRAPVPHRAGADEEGGRGLALVAALSAEWGYYYPPETPGKVTWAIIETP
jgi:hypothetical protein